MLKTFGMVAAAALLASVTAFAQDTQSSSPSTSDQTSAPAAAPADDTANTEQQAPKHHRHHMGSHMGTGSRATDMNADKLNACMANATPTAQQEQCLKAAAGTGNG
jgi:hypothetical protein